MNRVIASPRHDATEQSGFTAGQPTRRSTNRTLTGNLLANRAKQTLACCSVTPPSSYRIVPGLTTAAQKSGSPFPFPIRVSSGVLVTDLSGKIRIYSFPSSRTYCCAAIRPAWIVAALTHPASRDWIPKSPKTTRLPRVALPFMRPLWLFRCLTRRGISAIGVVSVCSLVDPHLNPDVPLRRHRFGEAVIDL